MIMYLFTNIEWANSPKKKERRNTDYTHEEVNPGYFSFSQTKTLNKYTSYKRNYNQNNQIDLMNVSHLNISVYGLVALGTLLRGLFGTTYNNYDSLFFPLIYGFFSNLDDGLSSLKHASE